MTDTIKPLDLAEIQRLADALREACIIDKRPADMLDALVAELASARTRQARALSLLRVAEAADLDIVSGRPLLDAVDERDTALSSAIRILAEE